MGYYTFFRGELTIDPPLPWSKFKDSGFKEGNRDYCLWLGTTESSEDTDNGELVKHIAERIVFCDESHNHYDMAEHLQQLVDEIGPGHQVRGRIDAEGEEAADIWRMKVIGSRVVQFKPQIVWPEESQ